MRVLVDIVHPAHVHFFHHPLRILERAGHEFAIASRDKDCTLALLDGLGFAHRCLSAQRTGVFGLACELWQRDRALARVARAFRPHVVTGLGGACAAHVGRWLGIPAVVFYDTENAHLQNALTYPFAHRVVVPRCYRGWTPRARTLRYDGYHELSYLHPARFAPDRALAERNGLATDRDTFVVRVVSWRANHDIGVQGWSAATFEAVVARLAGAGKVLISAEGELPPALQRYRYSGGIGALHHIVAHARAVVGESATLASEAAVLGVPAVYAASVSRGYIDEQQDRYGLVRVVPNGPPAAIVRAIESMLAVPAAELVERRQRMLADTVNVAAFVAETLVSEARS